MIDKPSPSFEMALQEEFKRFYLAGIETGYKRAKKEMSEFIVLPPAVAYEIHNMEDVKEIGK